jgi:hypothetical protein
VALVEEAAAEQARERALAEFIRQLPALAGRASALLAQGADGLSLSEAR